MKSVGCLYAIASYVVVAALGQTWCNKNYMQDQPIVLPGGQFPIPDSSDQPLLVFRCTPAVKPYLAGETSGSILIDSTINHMKVNGAVPFTVNGPTNLAVTVSVNGQTLVTRSVQINTSAHELPFSLNALPPQKKAYNVSCSAMTKDGHTFHTTTELWVLPSPKTGSVTKMDLRSGALLVNVAKGSKNSWEPIFPLGFYINFDGYLASNLSILNDMKAKGFNIVHPVPTFENLTALAQVLDHMENLGLFLVYDMRHTYINHTSVTEQVNMVKTRGNLLLWYTADEPDGTGDPLDAVQTTYDLINELDGYHPISLVLNCQDYEFIAYTRGADIIMQDVYPIGINATFSSLWQTPCTPSFGCCGCDNCKGEFEDISTRMDQYKQRLEILGDSRMKPLWSVPQALEAGIHWSRPPTGQEWLVASVLSINHGAVGIMPWIDPTPPGIKESAGLLAQALPVITQFLFHPDVIFDAITSNRVDVGLWTVGSSTLVLAANLNNAPMVSTIEIALSTAINMTPILQGGSMYANSSHQVQLRLDATSVLGYIIANHQVMEYNLFGIEEGLQHKFW